MPFRVFTLPVRQPGDAERDLNQFLRTHRTLAVDRRFHQDETGVAFWSFCVEFHESTEPDGRGFSGSKVDYKEILSPEDFAIYSKLRVIRKEAAEAEKLPPFALFNNEQLAEMVQKRVTCRKQLGEIKGIGESRLEKYGSLVLQVLEKEFGSGPSRPKSLQSDKLLEPKP